MAKRVFLCIGHAIMDSRCYINEFPKVDGMTLLLKPIQNSCGGSAANVAYNLSKMGLSSRLVAAVGDGSVRKFILNTMADEGVDVSTVKSFKGQDTGRAIVLIDRIGNVKVFESLESCDNYFAPKIEDFKDVFHVHMTGTNLKLLQSYSKIAHKLGITISFDPGRGKCKFGVKKLSSLLSRINILFVNRNELGLLVGRETQEPEAIKKACRELYNQFGFIPVIKAGGKETIAYDGKRFHTKMPKKVKVIDTIGAGDAFDSGFIASYICNKSVSKSISYGMKIAALKVQRLGAQALPAKRLIASYFKMVCKWK